MSFSLLPHLCLWPLSSCSLRTLLPWVLLDPILNSMSTHQPYLSEAAVPDWPHHKCPSLLVPNILFKIATINLQRLATWCHWRGRLLARTMELLLTFIEKYQGSDIMLSTFSVLSH